MKSSDAREKAAYVMTDHSSGELAKPADPQWHAPTGKDRLELLLVGDTAFGASYQEVRAAKGNPNILEKYGYDHGFERVDALLGHADLVVANLETPLTERRGSPFQDIRPYIHYDDPDLTLRHLLAHNIRAVTLANNHTHDMGVPGLLDTLEALDRHGLLAIGAGLDRARASLPLEIRADLRKGRPFQASVLNRFRGGRQFREVLKAYATDDSPGSMPFQTAETVRAVKEIKAADPDKFVVVTPHWRQDYKWASDGQREAAEALVDAGVDLIVGHGSHMTQEIDILDGRLVLHGIGNFLFNSPGRYQKVGVPPYSVMVRLTVESDQIVVRLYPIHTDNRRTDYQNHPVDSEQFREFHRTAIERTNDPRAFEAAVQAGEDQFGHHLAATLGRDGRISSGGPLRRWARRRRAR